MKMAFVNIIDCVHHYDTIEFYASSPLKFQPKSCVYLSAFQCVFYPEDPDLWDSLFN